MKNMEKSKKEWSRKYNKCIVCGTTNVKYKGKGMCKKCYYKKYREIRKEYFKEYYEKNFEKTREQSKKYKKEQSEELKEYHKNYQYNRNHNDICYKLKGRVSVLVNARLRRRLSSKKGKSTFSFLPYTIDELIKHLEKLFTVGMTWENYGYWHIDHKIPDCKFNYKNVEDREFQKCWALKNLQPLWALDNLRKLKSRIKI